MELGLLQQRHKAVLEVLNAATVTDVARRYGVVRQNLHDWCDATPATAWPLCRTEAPSLSDAIRWLFDCRRFCARTVDFVALTHQPFCGSGRRQQAAALVPVVADQPPMNVTCFA